MKRICSMILVLCIAFSMAACNSTTPNPTIVPTIPTADPTEPTAVPTDPTEPTFTVIRKERSFSKENVPEFMDLLYKKYPYLVDTDGFQESDFYNETPPGVFEATGIQIFSSHRQSFLMYNNKVYDLCTHQVLFGGKATNAILYDCDGDGVKDLIISYLQYNGGGYGHIIYVFNPVTSKKTIVSSPSAWSDSTFYVAEPDGENQAQVTVWMVTFDEESLFSSKHHSETYTYTVTGIAGHLKIVDGSLQFVPYTE